MILNSQNIGPFIKEFENDNAEKLSQFEIDGFLVWGILKNPIYFYYHNLENKKSDQITSISLFKKIKTYIASLLQLLLLLCKLNNFRKKKCTLIFTDGKVRWLKNEDDKLMNMWLDGFVLENMVSNPLLLEIRNSEIKNSAVKLGYNAKNFNLFFKINKQILKLIYSKKINKISIEFHNFLVGNKIEYPLENIIEGLYIFLSEKNIFNWFIKKTKPQLVVSYDKLTTGFLAAVNINNIPSIDVQHGIIGQFYASYNFSSALKNYKSKIALPSKIALFGNLEKKELLIDQFWNDGELYIGGSYRMFLFKKKKIPLNPKNILICTENINITKIVDVINFLIEHKIQLKIRLHPMESNMNILILKKLVSENKDFIEIISNHNDIYYDFCNAKVVIGHYSTTLLEAMQLGVTVLSVELIENDEGICKYYRNKELKDMIPIIHFNNYYSIIETINNHHNLPKIKIATDFLFAENYFENNKTAISLLLK